MVNTRLEGDLRAGDTVVITMKIWIRSWTGISESGLRHGSGRLREGFLSESASSQEETTFLCHAVHGLDGAPAESLATLVSHLVESGFTKSVLDPCLWLQRKLSEELEALIVLDVDDLVLGTHPDQVAPLQTRTRSTAARPQSVWCMDVVLMTCVSMSATTQELDGTQGAWLVVTVDRMLTLDEQ